MKIEDILVKTASKNEIIKLINIPLEKDQEIYFDNIAVYQDLYDIDPDCCFSQINQHLINGKIIPVLEIECRIKKRTPDGYTLRMDGPDFIAIVPLEDFLNIAEDVKLIDYIRYNYNPRIMRNQDELMKYINFIN